MLGLGLNLITTVIGFGMSATFIVFVCARLICCRIRSSDPRAAAAPFDLDLELEIELRSDLDTPTEHLCNGLEPVAVVVAAIPTMKYESEAFSSKEDAQCSICLGEYEEKEMLRIMPMCHHNFHLACIDVWLQKHSTCPICRMPVNDMAARKNTPPALPTFAIPESSANQSNRWLLPVHGYPGGRENARTMLESGNMIIGVPQNAQETRR